MGLWQIICIVGNLVFFVSFFNNALRNLNDASTYLTSKWYKHAIASVGWFLLHIVMASIALYFIINGLFVFK